MNLEHELYSGPVPAEDEAAWNEIEALDAVAPSLEMDAATLTKHLQARHSGPFEDVGLTRIDATPRDLKVWQAYHSREHRVYGDHDHYHRGEDDDEHSAEGSG